MRKLGILIGIIAAATLGFTGTASAGQHEETLCPALGDNPISQGIADGGGDDTVAGLQESCVQTNLPEPGLAPSPLLCGLSKDLTEGGAPEPIATLPQTINDGAVDGGANDLPIWVFEKCGGGVDDCTENCDNNGDDNNDQGGGGGADVQAANAAADGGLPRTGGELFAGAGFGLASLGALIRRFLG